MRIQEDIKPVTFMKTRAAELLRMVNETRRPVVITQNGEPQGVLLDVGSYQSLTDTKMMLELLGLGEDEERANRTVSQDDVFAQARQRLTD